MLRDRARRRGLRRLGVLQARATAAHRRRAGVAGHRPATSGSSPRAAVLAAALGPALPRPPSTPSSPAAARCPAAPRHRRARRPGGDRQPAAARSRRARRAPSAADAERCTALAAPRAWSRRPPGGRPAPPAAAAAATLPRYRAMEQSFDRIGPHGRSDDVLAPPPCRSASTPASAADRRRALGRPARARAGAARGVRQLAAAARAAHRVEVDADGGWLRARSRRAPRRPPTRTPATRPRTGRGGRWTPSCCACARRRGGVGGARRRHVRRLDRRRAATPAHHRRPRLPPVHAVPAGAPARPPRGPLPRHAAGQASGRSRSPCSRRCSPTPGDDRRARRRLRAGCRAAGSPPPATGWPTASLARRGRQVFELADSPALPDLGAPRRWLDRRARDAIDRRRRSAALAR